MSSISIRNYLLTDNDTIYRLSNAKLNRLLSGSEKDTLAIFAGKRVRNAEVVITIADRKPVEVVRASYTKLQFDDHGKLDQKRHEDDLRISMEAVFSDSLFKESSVSEDLEKPRINNNVIYRNQIFSQRKRDNTIRWTPNSKLECEIFDLAIGITKCKTL